MISNTYPIETTAPDITPYRAGNIGVEYVTTLDSGREGPHALVVAVTHGNEICGAITLDFLFRENVQPTRGKLTLAFSNHAAYHNFDPENPNDSRQVEEDLNRVWDEEDLNGERDTPDIRRARELRPIVDQADFMLDIHSMFFPIAPLIIAGPTDKSREMSRDVSFPDSVISDFGHKQGRRMRDYGAFSDPDSPKTALLVECGQHWAAACASVSTETTVRFLQHLDVVDADWARAQLPAKPPTAQKFIKVTEAVTIKTDQFKFVEPYQGYEVIAKGGTAIAYDGDEPVITPYDNCVLVMPTHRLSAGRSAVRLGHYTEPPVR
ncbi:MAG: succinylglutamate desuccinylase [Rhodospirillaceae bacterium]|jgi:predicted deacylase|nr:succinylglutamate desuccinylase [Rhodospirillaceae bacterium]